MTPHERGFWSLRLAAGEIADADQRQLFLNALAEAVRLAPSGRLLDQVLDPSRSEAAGDPADCTFDIGLFHRRL